MAEPQKKGKKGPRDIREGYQGVRYNDHVENMIMLMNIFLFTFAFLMIRYGIYIGRAMMKIVMLLLSNMFYDDLLEINRCETKINGILCQR